MNFTSYCNFPQRFALLLGLLATLGWGCNASFVSPSGAGSNPEAPGGGQTPENGGGDPEGGGGTDAPGGLPIDDGGGSGGGGDGVDPGTPDPGTPDPGRPDPGTPDPGTPDPGNPDPTPGEPIGDASLVPVFFAQGHHGRTLMSCDGGRSWIRDRSRNDAYRCFSGGGNDCDHSAFAGRGLAADPRSGTLAITWGWGNVPGLVQVTEDGVNWRDVLAGSTFADIAFGQGSYVAGGGSPLYFGPNGENPTRTGWSLGSNSNPRGIGHATASGGLFLVSGDGGAGVSTDAGRTWSRADACNGTLIDMASNGSVAVAALTSGKVCVSNNRGSTWTASKVTDGLRAGPVYHAGRFMVWGNGAVWTSSNGAQWTRQATSRQIAFSSVAVDRDGNFASSDGGWTQWYDNQRFYHSRNGIDWQVATARGGHPIRFIQAAMLRRHPQGCP